jgi:hypothetical protein
MKMTLKGGFWQVCKAYRLPIMYFQGDHYEFREKIKMILMINFCITSGTIKAIFVHFEGKLHKVFINFT